jgi:glyoxylase-like metal-dependent hydrolase (beta-lactamase superfamily II)
MVNDNDKVEATQLREWLDRGVPVFVLDIRPLSQRQEWQIPGSHYLDAYKRLNEGDISVFDEIEIPHDAKVITVCAAGRTSQIASQVLKEKGFDAFSLQGGMKAWSTAWNTAQKKFTGFEVLQIRRTGKGCLSYIVSSDREAVIIDASLPVDIYVQCVKQNDLSVKYVIETHIHADHLSRSKEVAEYFNVPLFLPVPNKVEFPFQSISASTALSVGRIMLWTIPTPGHTMESVSFYIEKNVVFTGDTLFTNGVGRPDLKSDDNESRSKAVLLYHSLKKLLSLPDEVLILPAHTSKPVEFDRIMLYSTIGEVKKNIALLQLDENDFAKELLQKIPPTPPNYLSIVEKNLSGNFSENDSGELEAGANRCAVS